MSAITSLDFLTRMFSVYESIGRMMANLGINPYTNTVTDGKQQSVSRFVASADYMLDWEVDIMQRCISVSLTGYGGASEVHGCLQIQLKETGWMLKRLRLQDLRVPPEERRTFSEIAPGNLTEQTLTEEQATGLIEKIIRRWKAEPACAKTVEM